MRMFSDAVVDRVEVPQDKLNIVRKKRSNPLKWRGQFSPQLVEVLLDNYSNATDVILDPFVGSGTVLWEAAKRGNAVYGSEINPAAFMLSNLYSFVNIQPELRNAALSNVDMLLIELFPPPLFARTQSTTDAIDLKIGLKRLLANVDDNIEARLVRALIILLDLYQPNLTVSKVLNTWRRIKDLISGLPSSETTVTVFHADARSIPKSNNSIDLVITSPPYINVFNYHQQYRASVEFLDFNPLEVAKSEIGSNRKNRGNRFLTVIQYCLDMAQCFAELQRLCKRDSRIIFVVGRRSAVRGVSFYNGEILADVILRSFGANLVLRQERVFRNRFGQDIYEDILHFSLSGAKLTDEEQYLTSARSVANKVLMFALEHSDDETSEGLRHAIANLPRINPSPPFVRPNKGNLE